LICSASFRFEQHLKQLHEHPIADKISSQGKSDNVKITTNPVTIPTTDQNAAESLLCVGSSFAKN
jgi:hypothetical protein